MFGAFPVTGSTTFNAIYVRENKTIGAIISFNMLLYSETGPASRAADKEKL